MDQIWTTLQLAQRELLLFSAFWFCIGALDDLLIDMMWIAHKIRRWLTRYRSTPAQTASQLACPARPGLIAVFIPAWQEAEVITQMLQRCGDAWGGSGSAYRIYVGAYPNDNACIRAIREGARGNPDCRLVLCSDAGPTTKADCLNRLWRAMAADELAAGFKVKAIVLHDAEDFVHRDELRIFDLLIERATAVQLPVIPIQVGGSTWISGHYGDEFAEAHGKALVVREAIGAALPLAGVGCAIERNHLGRVALAHGGAPFDATSLTEDYELGLGVSGKGARTIFARIADERGDLVGTRACFPDTLSSAVRQKTRWTIGIALAGWDRLGWQGGVAEIWMRLRDRKAIFAAVVLTAAYACIVLTVILFAGKHAGLPPPAPLPATTVTLLIANGLFLVWRQLVRAWFVFGAQGAQAALLSLPRTIIANIISIMAARRAVFAYLKHVGGGTLRWDKTPHRHFPRFPAKSGELP